MSVKMIVSKIMDNFVYKSRSGVARGLYRRGGISFIPRKPTAEESFLLNLNLKNKVIYDIGGYVGLHSIYFGAASLPNGKVYVFEPNPINYNHIINNIKCNKLYNIYPINKAVGDENTLLKMSYDPEDTGRGSIDHNINKFFKQEINIESTTIDSQIINGLPVPEFIKIDTEGYEYKILLGAEHLIKTSKPALFIENHGSIPEEKINNIKQIIELLSKYGYKIIHVESNIEITKNNYQQAKEGHIYCEGGVL